MAVRSDVIITLLVIVAQAPASRLWVDATAATIGETKEWTNKVEAADVVMW